MPPESVSQDETGFWRCLASNIHQMLPFSSFTFYFRHAALLPSFSLALLYFTVLSFSGQMVTFLLAVGLTSVHVGVIRAASTIFELSATWVGPRLMSYMGTVRAGIWSLSWQMICLGVGVIWSFAGERLSFGGMGSVAGLVGGVILSRLGLWSFDLCAQSIVQEVRDDTTRMRERYIG